MGCVAAVVFSSFGASYGIAKSSIGALSAGVIRPDLAMHSLLPSIFAGILAIYGLVSAVLISGHIRIDLSLYTAFINLGSGLAGVYLARFSTSPCSLMDWHKLLQVEGCDNTVLLSELSQQRRCFQSGLAASIPACSMRSWVDQMRGDLQYDLDVST